MNNPIQPHAPAPVSTLVMRWVAARAQLDAARVLGEPGKPADYWEALRLGTAISREVLADRWSDVAHLLQASAVESWAQAGQALAVTEAEARDGFLAWLAGEVHHGLSRAEGSHLAALAERVIW